MYEYLPAHACAHVCSHAHTQTHTYASCVFLVSLETGRGHWLSGLELKILVVFHVGAGNWTQKVLWKNSRWSHYWVISSGPCGCCFKLCKLLFNQLEVSSKYHVHFHLCVFICVCGGYHICLWRPQDNLKCPWGILLNFSGPESLISLDLTNQATLTSQWAPKVCLSQFLQHWGYKCAPLWSALLHGLWGLNLWLGLYASRQALSLLSYFPCSYTLHN